MFSHTLYTNWCFLPVPFFIHITNSKSKDIRATKQYVKYLNENIYIVKHDKYIHKNLIEDKLNNKP